MKLNERDAATKALADHALAHHAEALMPSNNLASSTSANRYDLMPNRSTLPAFNVTVARALACERIRLKRELTTEERTAVILSSRT